MVNKDALTCPHCKKSLPLIEKYLISLIKENEKQRRELDEYELDLQHLVGPRIRYVATRVATFFHRPGCELLGGSDERGPLREFKTRAAARAADLEPCNTCLRKTPCSLAGESRVSGLEL
jgi:hypothetical protein